MAEIQTNTRFGVVLCSLALTLTAGGASRRDAAQSSGDAASAHVYLKIDFESDRHLVAVAGNGTLAYEDHADPPGSGRSLLVRRVRPGGSFGATVSGLQIQGGSALRIGFAVRAVGMQNVSVSLFDDVRQGDTTTHSPARIFDDQWHAVLFAVDDFHYDSESAERAIQPEARFSRLTFAGLDDSPEAAIRIDNVVVYRGRDARAPEPPSGIRIEQLDDGRVHLRWPEAVDDTFAAVYGIYRRHEGQGWEKLAESSRPDYSDSVPASGTYSYRVTAADYEGNISWPSPEVLVTIRAGAAPTAADPVIVSDRRTYATNVRGIRARGRGRARPDVFLFAGDSLTEATVYTYVQGSWLARGTTVRQGVQGATAESGASRIREYLESSRPEFAVLLYGTNDDKSPRGVAEAMRHVAEMVDTCVEFGTIPVLVTIPPRGYQKDAQRDQERYNLALTDLSRQKAVPVSYAFDEMMRHDLRTILYDGVHLVPDAGNDAAGLALRRTMDQLYFALRDTSAGW